MLLEDGWLGIDRESKTRIIDYLTSKENKTTLLTITDDEEFIAKCTRKITLTKGTIL
jgi:predicted ABC-type transport system involved in lysophospholipase L1 biosynthesis ATPase subunit